MVVLVAVAVLVLVVLVVFRHRLQSRLPEGVSDATIDASGGVHLAAEVTVPSSGSSSGSSSAAARHPLIVMPASAGSGANEYQILAGRWAAAGFVVVAYAQRGFGGSGGVVDFAGGPTQADASTVISWALQHTPSDPDRVGMAGISYGAGMSLLTAAHDTRVRAVVALDTWTDLEDSWAPNGTVDTSALTTLFGKGTGLSPDLQRLGREASTDPSGALATLRSLSPSRSPSTYLDALNRRKVPVMLGNGWQDSIFQPTQLVDFYDRLTGPKRLEFATGDHTGPDLAGLAGGSARSTDDALLWLTKYVAGGSPDLGPPVELQDVATGQWHGYPSWPAATGVPAQLGAPGGNGLGAGTTAAGAWSASFTTGTDTAATSGPSQFVAAANYHVPVAPALTPPGANGLTWAGGATTSPVVVSGTPELDVSVGASQPSATFFVYLYDSTSATTAALMSVTPFTISGLTTTATKAVTLRLNPISWTLAAGHQLVVAVDSVDPRFASSTPKGTQVTFASTAGHPATLSTPTG